MLTKKHIKSRNICKVTFEVSKSELPEVADVETIAVAGDFNDWDSAVTAMVFSRKKKAYRATVELEPSQQYQFRYLLNGEQWFNDWEADSYIPGPLGEDNCVLQTPSGE
jgi:1,4-alpha-glucan branching enzyme